MRALVLVLLAACAWASALPDGTPIKGTVTITGSPGTYAGSVNAVDLGIFPIGNVVV